MILQFVNLVKFVNLGCSLPIPSSRETVIITPNVKHIDEEGSTIMELIFLDVIHVRSNALSDFCF